MYLSTHIKNFRGFDDLLLDGLSRVNLITGSNNTGKTSLLEALLLLSSARNPRIVVQLDRARGVAPSNSVQGFDPPWSSLFPNYDTSKPLELTSTRADGHNLELSMSPTPDPQLVWRLAGSSDDEEPVESTNPGVSDIVMLGIRVQMDGQTVAVHNLRFDTSRGYLDAAPPWPPGASAPSLPAVFLPSARRSSYHEDVRRFSQLEMQGRESLVVEALRIIEPRLKRLSVVVYGRDPMLFGDVGRARLLPLSVMGEGMVRLASIVLAIGTAANGVALIDEIENGLHHSVMLRVWQVVKEAADLFDVQVFATTHSLECIRAAYAAFADAEPYQLSVQRLERSKGDWSQVRSVKYDREMLETALQMGFEVRG